MKLRSIIIIATLILSGCASTVRYQEERSAASDEASIYVIRKYAEPTARRLNVICDGQMMAQLANRSYVKIYLKEGTRKLQFAWPSSAGMSKIDNSIEARAGESRYFLVSGEVVITRVLFLGPIMKISARDILYVGEVSAETARELTQKLSDKCEVRMVGGAK